MSIKVKESLHELIKYLSKSEKRYFKIHSSRHIIGDENNYIILFDFLEAQESYDEEALFIHFKGEAFLNKFSVTKKRLYDHILTALDAYHSSASIDAQIYRLLHSADILYQKSLYEQSRRQLRSAEKLALKHERYNLLSEVSLKQKRLIESSGYADSDEVERIFKNDLNYHDKSQTYDQFWNLKSRLFELLASKGISRTETDLIQFKAIIDELLLTKKSKELDFESHYLYNHIYSAYFFAIANMDDSYTYLQANIELLESRKEYIESKPNRYFSILTNAIFVAAKLKKTNETHGLLKKLKQLTTDYSIQPSEDFNIKLFSSINSIELTVLILRGELEEAKKLVPLIESGMLLYADKLTSNRKAFLDFKIATVLFVTQDYHAALKWINRILNDAELDRQEDILSFAHILSLLIHFEMKNESLLPYAIRSAQRFLKARNRLYHFETLFLKYITRMSKTTDVFKLEEIFEELYKELNRMKDDSFDNVAFDYFDFNAWAVSKLKRVSFEEIIRMNYRTNA